MCSIHDFTAVIAVITRKPPCKFNPKVFRFPPSSDGTSDLIHPVLIDRVASYIDN
ncbi:hypothetical protein [cyanobacterium endosymbiont of Rhopalodia gibberula]|uniref:hypothetical protein n=1 Tax=cyanobacterium endosymbiont of Rhopalodia gibberula TaxID=1763363 RepID=UPI001559879D|nr:hypothetical protein [cyanobacterium endosymbiont of Rhopalodia gibberula]